MMYASRKQMPPRLPCSRTLRSLRVPTVWEPDERAEKLLKVLGSSFRDNSEQQPSTLPLDDEFRMLLAVLAEVTVALDHSQRLGLDKVFKDPRIFLGNCDWVTHGLLSMPSFLTKGDGKSSGGLSGEDGEDISESPHSRAAGSVSASLDSVLCEICRLGTLLYVDIVIYPTPPQAGVKNQLSRLLLPLLQSLEETSLLEEDALVVDLVLWAAMMGAISARCTELQDTYIDYIADNCTPKSRSWEDIELGLQSFCWFSSVCDESAKQIWCQAQDIAATPDR